MDYIKFKNQNELYHHGIIGQRWGVRRYENPDGTLTKAGKKRYAKQNTHIDDKGHLTEEGKQFYSNMGKRHIKSLNNVLVKPLMMPVKGTVSLAKKFFHANVNAVKNVAGSSTKTVEQVMHDGIEGEASMDYIKFKNQNELYHHGIIGQRWGVRRFQNEDGSLTPRGERRLAKQEAKIAAREAKAKSASEKYNAKTKYLKAKNEAKAKQMQLKNEERALKAEQKKEAGKQRTRRFLIGAAATVGIGALIYKYKKHVADNEHEEEMAAGRNALEKLKINNKHEENMLKLGGNLPSGKTSKIKNDADAAKAASKNAKSKLDSGTKTAGSSKTKEAGPKVSNAKETSSKSSKKATNAKAEFYERNTGSKTGSSKSTKKDRVIIDADFSEVKPSSESSSKGKSVLANLLGSGNSNNAVTVPQSPTSSSGGQLLLPAPSTSSSSNTWSGGKNTRSSSATKRKVTGLKHKSRLRHSMMSNDYLVYRYLFNDELYHYGIIGQRWGVRRFENPDGTLTDAGKARYNTNKEYKKSIDMTDEDLRKSTSRLRAERDYERAQENSYEKRIPNTARKALIVGGASAVLTFGATLLTNYITGSKGADGKRTAGVLGSTGKEAAGKAALIGLLTGVAAGAATASKDVRVANSTIDINKKKKD